MHSASPTALAGTPAPEPGGEGVRDRSPGRLAAGGGVAGGVAPEAGRAWRRFEDELDTWAEGGRRATFWWRDDDASGPSPALDRLLGLHARFRVPLALAVIPGRLSPGLAAGLGGRRELLVLQHGWAHENHAGAGEKSVELGPGREPEQVIEELARGFERLVCVFGARFVPVLVPPWNRIAEAFLPPLPGIGLRGLSTFGTRARAEPRPGLRQINCHVDPIDWRGGRGGRDHRVLAGELAAHLRARREGRCDAGEPIGLLSHHLDHDEAGWAFIEAFLERAAAHPAAHWPAADALFRFP